MTLRSDKELTLNLGSGDQTYGDVRLDLFPTASTNIVGDCQHLPFREGAFARVYEQNLFEHLPNPGRHLDEVRRVLMPSGVLTLITDNAACLKFYILGTHTGGYRKHDGKDVHYAVFTLEHIRNFVANSGLRLRQLKLVDTDYYTRIIDRVVRVFAPSLSYPRIYLEAERP
ncbi:MAG: methyltransferase domain-containing protein [archaeon]|nr:MAG: methyltransferase domain-containing protein [archaeon]